MRNLKTNYIRTDINSQCFRYQFQLISNQPIDSKFYHQIQGYFISINQLIVFSFPYVYSIDQMKELKSFNFMLSNGQKTQIIILTQNTITLNSKQISAQIHQQLMKGTNFLYSEKLHICLNPFQQKKVSYSTSLMPGFSIVTEAMNNCIGFYLIPLEARITQFHSISCLHDNSIILDYDSGSFYQKSSIVRYDKVNQILYFRTGQTLSKNSLKSLDITYLSGIQLALKLNNYYRRIRQTQKLKMLIQKWQIKFDSRFMQLPYNFFPVSHILARNTEEKSLGQIIGSISSYNFQYNFRKVFSNLTFDDSIRANIYFIIPKLYQNQQIQIDSIEEENDINSFYQQYVQQEEQFLLPIITQFQNMKTRMNLDQCKIQVVNLTIYSDWANGIKKTLREIDQFIEKEKEKDTIQKIFVITNLQQLLRNQRQLQLGKKFILGLKQNIQPLFVQLSNHFVSSGTYYHVIDVENNQFKNCNDIVALKAFSTIYSKLRVNPWKIKQVPFGTKPLMVFSLYVKIETNGGVLITLIGSLNLFLSKYTSIVSKSSKQQYHKIILLMVKQLIQKFKSIHRVFPTRAIIFRNGDLKQLIEIQLGQLQTVLIPNYNCKPTLVVLNSEYPLRVYNQIDTNYISKDTVKPTQLLCQLKYNNQRYIQLQMGCPLYKIQIFGGDQQDPYFQQKIIELTTKLCFTFQLMTQLKFGKGLGFVGYGQKLYNWTKQIKNIEGMEHNLKEGILIFL